MFDANQILGMLMESGMARSGQSRVQRLAGSGQGGGGIGDIAGALLGGGNRGSAGGMGDIAGALLGGGGNRAVGSGGAMGMLGSLAAVAMQHFGAAQGFAEPGLAEEAAPYRADNAAAGPNNRATVMIRAMIDAAKADGEIDPQERQRILGRLEDAGADPDARAFVADAMAGPGDLNAIIAAVDSPHTAVEVYAASLFAIDVDTPAEAAYMRRLASGLGLDPVLVRSLHQSLDPPA